ncbi:MAG TPA: DUF3309 family protein [Mesorhizobium sp.]|jgi:hypothetical protein|nr:DUF3309 family protein [Mesorhizobium sp.]
MTLSTALVIALVLLLAAALPVWPHSRGWGFGPSGILGAAAILLLALMAFGG